MVSLAIAPTSLATTSGPAPAGTPSRVTGQ